MLRDAETRPGSDNKPIHIEVLRLFQRAYCEDTTICVVQCYIPVPGKPAVLVADVFGPLAPERLLHNSLTGNVAFIAWSGMHFWPIVPRGHVALCRDEGFPLGRYNVLHHSHSESGSAEGAEDVKQPVNFITQTLLLCYLAFVHTVVLFTACPDVHRPVISHEHQILHPLYDSDHRCCVMLSARCAWGAF